MQVVDTAGNPVANESVALGTRATPGLVKSANSTEVNSTQPVDGGSPTPQIRGVTSPSGCLIIYFGPLMPFCGNYTLTLPDRPDVEAVDTGCTIGGVVKQTFVVPGEEWGHAAPIDMLFVLSKTLFISLYYGGL